MHTFRYSFVISWYWAVMVLGAGRAIMRIPQKRMKEMPMPSMVYPNTRQFSPGGGRALGPWGPNAIQYAAAIIFY